MTAVDRAQDGLAVYVPAPGSVVDKIVWDGSGIVGSPVGETGRLRIDFEGNRELFPSFADRLHRAAERHTWSKEHQKGYPTRACAHVDADEVTRIGTYSPSSRTLDVVNPDPLARWLGNLQDEQKQSED